jgi:hypothetical protein
VVESGTLVAMPEALRWTGHPVLREAHDNYTRLVSDALAAVLSSASRQNRDRATRLADALSELSGENLLRLVLAPLTTHQLLFREYSECVVRHLENATLVESRRADRGPSPKAPVWGALGDCVVLPEGELVAAPTLESGIPLDLDSPQAATDDVGHPLKGKEAAEAPIPVEARTELVERLNLACAGIAAVSDAIHSFVVQYTKVLVLQSRPGKAFSSGSTGEHIGRTLLINPHAPYVDEAELAEALVHEAIHSLLYMQEAVAPWILDAPQYAVESNIISPWTGRPLPMRPFLQACFVWYGLTHFWGQAGRAGSFPADRARSRLRIAATGFFRADLTASIPGACRDVIAPAVLESIDRMQQHILGSRPAQPIAHVS